ncbi:hypothetical protein LY76DRAFT_480589, partial [Colletotrichum caudatum]
RDIDYYGVTFDYLVPPSTMLIRKVLQINIIEMDGNHGDYANKHLAFSVDASQHAGKRVSAVPRCCQRRKGTQDRQRVSS